MGNFYTDVIQKSTKFRSNSRHDDLDLLEPTFRSKVEAIISDGKKHGFELMVYETYRSQERQQELYNHGATQLKKVGVHGYGLAADIVRVVNGQPSWDNLHIVFHLAIAHELVSGQNWHYPNPPNPHGFVDNCHVQRISLKDQDRLFNNSWYPDRDYKPY